MKVFLWDVSYRNIEIAGESDMKRFDQDWVKVNGQLYHAAFVFPDTPENRETVKYAIATLKKMEDDRMTFVYDTFNRLRGNSQ